MSGLATDLLQLHEAHRYGKRGTDKSPISVGTILLVHDDKPCGFWSITMGCDKDGSVRGAYVRITSGKDRLRVIKL